MRVLAEGGQGADAASRDFGERSANAGAPVEQAGFQCLRITLVSPREAECSDVTHGEPETSASS